MAEKVQIFLWKILLLSMLVTLSTWAIEIEKDCIYKASTVDYLFFNYENLDKSDIDHKIEYEKGKGTQVIEFNLWGTLHNVCRNSPSRAIMYPKNTQNLQGECHLLQSLDVDRYVECIIPFSMRQTFVPWNSDSKEEEHLIVHYKSDERCIDNESIADNPTHERYTLDIEIFCDREMSILDEPVITSTKNSKNPGCRINVEMRSRFGCKISKTETIDIFFSSYYWAFAILFITFGVYNILFGGKMFRLTILLFGIISTIAWVFFLLFFLLEISNMPQWLIWLSLLTSASVGAIIGYFMTRIIKVGVCVIGCWTGFIIAFLIHSLLFSRFNLNFMLYVLVVVLVALFGWLAYKYYEYVLIFSSSILGSYFLVRGISFLIGGYPNEMNVLEQIKHGAVVEIPWPFYLYLVCMLAFAIFGVVVQVKRLNKKDKKKKGKGKRKLKIKKKDEVGAVEGQKEKSYVDMEEEEDI